MNLKTIFLDIFHFRNKTTFKRASVVFLLVIFVIFFLSRNWNCLIYSGSGSAQKPQFRVVLVPVPQHCFKLFITSKLQRTKKGVWGYWGRVGPISPVSKWGTYLCQFPKYKMCHMPFKLPLSVE